MDEPSRSTSVLQSNSKSLTRSNLSNELYQRHPDAERQIAEVLPLERPQLFERLNVESLTDAEFLLEETLVYLMREARLANDDELFNAVTTTLFRRTQKIVARRTSGAVDNNDAAIEAAANVLNELFIALGDVSSDKSDFAQVRLNLFVKRIVNRHVARAQKQLRRDRLANSIDEPDDDHDYAPTEIAAAPEMSYEDWEFIKKALEILSASLLKRERVFKRAQQTAGCFHVRENVALLSKCSQKTLRKQS